MGRQSMDKKLRRQVSRRYMEHRDIIAAGALVLCAKTNRYLFLLRNGHSHSGTWGIIGGKIKSDETIIDGLHREIREEIGFEFTSNKIIPVEKFTSDTGKFIYHTYVIIVNEEFVPILNNEHRGYCWVPLNDHPKPMHPGVWRMFSFDAVITKIKTIENILNDRLN